MSAVEIAETEQRDLKREELKQKIDAALARLETQSERAERMDELLQLIDPFGMDAEELDGFLVALVCTPSPVSIGEFLPEILDLNDVALAEPEFREFLELLQAHWNDIAGALGRGEPYIPMIFPDEDGPARGNCWAHGFVRGTFLHRQEWSRLSESEEDFALLLPMMALHYEDDPDSSLRPWAEPLDPDKRHELFAVLSVSLNLVYERLGPHRGSKTLPIDIMGGTFRQPEPKTGRNQPCPCGSGKKYKRCCAS